MARLTAAWRALEREQRIAALAASGLFVSMFLPWYSKTDTVVLRGKPQPVQVSLSAFQDFSFVEAAVLLVSAGVLAMLFARGERRSFQLPGGDGLIVAIAGGWTAILMFYRLLDKPGVKSSHGSTATTTVGVEWGIFIALLVALGLLYTGNRMRAAARAEPSAARPRAGQPPDAGGAVDRDPAPADPSAHRGEGERSTAVLQARPGPQTAASALGRRGAARGRPRYPPPPAEQMSFEDPPGDAPGPSDSA